MAEIGVGFSFRGIHTNDLNVVLGNNVEEMHIFNQDIEYNSDTVDGRDGAYPSGSHAKQIDFDISLICEDFTPGDMMKVAKCFERDSYGKLIFDHMPYKYYNARVVSRMTPPLYVKYDAVKKMFLYNGVITVKLTAFSPYALAVDDVVNNYPNIGDILDTVENSTGIIESAKRPTTQKTNLSGESIFLLLNQGNAPANCDIAIGGTGDGDVSITNVTNSQTIYIHFSDNVYQEYLISSYYGRTTKKVDTTYVPADTIKSGDFITLSPCMNIYRDIIVTGDNTSSVSINAAINNDMIGKHIYIDDRWCSIESISGNKLVLNDTVSTGTHSDCVISSMNNFLVNTNTVNLSYLNFIYKDTFY